VVAKIEIGALPVMWLTLKGTHLQQLNQYARNVTGQRLDDRGRRNPVAVANVKIR
jgi:hypothetical protein